MSDLNHRDYPRVKMAKLKSRSPRGLLCYAPHLGCSIS